MESDPTTGCLARVSIPGLLFPEYDVLPTELPGAPSLMAAAGAAAAGAAAAAAAADDDDDDDDGGGVGGGGGGDDDVCT